MAGNTISQSDWPDAASVIRRERNGELNPPPHRPTPPQEEEFAKGVRCVLIEALRPDSDARARRIRNLDNRRGLDVRIIDLDSDETFTLSSEGISSEPLTKQSTVEEIEAAVVALNFDVVEVLKAGSRWLISVRWPRDERRDFRCDKAPYEVAVAGPHRWSVEPFEIEVTLAADRLPPDAVDDGSTLSGGAEAIYAAGLIGVAITGVDGEYFFDVPHLYESVTSRPVVVRHRSETAGTTVVCEIMHVEADTTDLPDDYNPAEIYPRDPTGIDGRESALVGRSCGYVSTGLFLVAHNPRPNEILFEGFYIALLVGGSWILDNQASWLEDFS